MLCDDLEGWDGGRRGEISKREEICIHVARSRHYKLRVSHLVMSNSLQPHGLYSPGSSVHGIFQTRILEWVAVPLSRRSSRARD